MISLFGLVCIVAVATASSKQHSREIEEVDCPSGWVKERESCYWFSKDYLNWFQAAAKCREKGAHLVTVNDVFEHSFLSGYMLNPALVPYYIVGGNRTNDNYPYGGLGIIWIGINDVHMEGTFRWVDTDAPITFTTWDKGQPDNYLGKEHCGHYFGGTTLMWNDITCSFLGTFICEK